MMVLLAAFTAALQISSDSTAGERERGALESLLLNPVPRIELITGKWLAAAIFAARGLSALFDRVHCRVDRTHRAIVQQRETHHRPIARRTFGQRASMGVSSDRVSDRVTAKTLSLRFLLPARFLPICCRRAHPQSSTRLPIRVPHHSSSS